MTLIQDLASQLGFEPPAPPPPVPRVPRFFFPAIEFEASRSSAFGKIDWYAPDGLLHFSVHSDCCGKRLFDVSHHASGIFRLGRGYHGDVIEVERKCPCSNCGAIERNLIEVGTGRVPSGAKQGTWRCRRKHYLGNANVLKGRIDVPCPRCDNTVRVDVAEIVRAAVLAAEQALSEAEESPEQDS